MWPPLATTPRHLQALLVRLGRAAPRRRRRHRRRGAGRGARRRGRCRRSSPRRRSCRPRRPLSQSGVPRPITSASSASSWRWLSSVLEPRTTSAKPLPGRAETGWWRSQAPGRGGHDRVAGALERVDGDRGGAQVRLGLAVDDEPGRSRCDPVLELLRPHDLRPARRRARRRRRSRRRAPRWMPPTHTRPASGQAGTATTTASVQLRALEQPGELVGGRAAQASSRSAARSARSPSCAAARPRPRPSRAGRPASRACACPPPRRAGGTRAAGPRGARRRPAPARRRAAAPPSPTRP